MNYDPAGDVSTGQEARDKIFHNGAHGESEPTGEPLPESATNFYIFEGGSFSGTIQYWSFDCGSVDDCWTALASLGGLLHLFEGRRHLRITYDRECSRS